MSDTHSGTADTGHVTITGSVMDMARLSRSLEPPVFTARLLTAPSKLRQALEEQAPKGEAEILVSVFDIPDTHVAMGNTRRQIIDHGAFRSYLNSNPFPEPYFLDHGGMFGPHRAELRIGKVTAGQETGEGLVISTAYNLAKQVAREAFSELEFNPEVVGFSFASNPDKEKLVERDGDPFEHITEMWPEEYSHVGFGAQEQARLLTARQGREAWTPEKLGELLNSEEFMAVFGAVLVKDPARARDVLKAAEAALADVPPNAVGEFYSKLFSRYE